MRLDSLVCSQASVYDGVLLFFFSFFPFHLCPFFTEFRFKCMKYAGLGVAETGEVV